MDEAERQFIRGNRNPGKYGFSLRASNGSVPDQSALKLAASLLGRETFFIDQRGYECELIGGAVHPTSGRVAYVESRAKKRRLSSIVDVTIKVHVRESDGSDQNADIKSYNPFFGCDIGFFQWFDDVALLVYAEKHNTYACAVGSSWPPKFIELEDQWIIKDRTLAYIGYKQDTVKQLALPDLTPLDPMSIEKAKSLGLLPDDPYAK